MITDKELKKMVKPKFHQDFENFYPSKKLQELGFNRSICKKCGKGFWSTVDRETCDDVECIGKYSFIGKNMTKRKFGYKEAWDEFVKTFEQWGYKPIDRYPTASRWFDDLYFVVAGINDFQPYVISGEQKPPAQAVLEPQPCLRFVDIDNVGLTGSHYSLFIMVGQHVFNYPDNYLYFKDEGIEQINHYLTKTMGIKSADLVYHEDVWAGGGNFGPSLEFFSGGIELGNQVYMQYKAFPDGSYEELNTRVIDMGAGLERWAWFSQGEITSYESVFPQVIKFIREKTNVTLDRDVWGKFAPYMGRLNVDEVEDVKKEWNEVIKLAGLEKKDIENQILPNKDLYTLADHTRALLVAIVDGTLPSNVGGGYNLRNLLRRSLSIINRNKWDIDIKDVFKAHADEFGSWFTELREFGNLFDIIDTEQERFKQTRKKNTRMINRIASKESKISDDKMLTLYESHGVTPELVKEVNPNIELPQNFYSKLEAFKEERRMKERLRTKVMNSDAPETELIYYSDPYKTECEATVVDIQGEWIVLDKTVFYPEGGGQAGDIGTINKAKIIDTQLGDKRVFHKALKHNFKKGTKVKAKIDWNNRYSIMKNHSATHIVNSACLEVLGNHVWQAGAKKTAEKAHLDITHYKSVSFEETQKIEKIANRSVFEGIVSETELLDRDEAEARYGFQIYQGGAIPSTELRVVKSKDIEACGGTHLHNSNEIGLIKILKTSRISDGIVRIEFTTGENAFNTFQHQENLLNEVGELWKIGYEDVPKTGLKFFEQSKSLKKEKDKLEEEFAKTIVADAIKNMKFTIKLPISNIKLLENVARKYYEEGQTLVLIGTDKCFGIGPNAKEECEKYSKKIKVGKDSVSGFQLKS